MANQIARNVGFQVLGDGTSTTFTADVRDLFQLGQPSIEITAQPVGVVPDGTFGAMFTGPTSPHTTVTFHKYDATFTFDAPLNAGALYNGQPFFLF